MPGTLTHSPADILSRALITLGLGTDPASNGAWPVFAHKEPDQPDNAIVVYDTEGFMDARLMPTGEWAEHEGIQVMVRSATDRDGWTKARAIAIALDTQIYLTQVVIAPRTYLIDAITQRKAINPLGYEIGSSRSLFTINATMPVTQTA